MRSSSSSFAATATTSSAAAALLHPQIQKKHSLSTIRASISGAEPQESLTNRRKILSTLILSSSVTLGFLHLHAVPPPAVAENWGTRSFMKERYFEPGLSPEDAVLRIRQTAEGLHSMRHMLDTMSWRYVIFYIRLKQAYLSQDLKNAMNMLPEGRRKAYVKTANELVDNMVEFDYYVRTPKVYESYLYYEKTLKSIDELVAQLA